MICFGCSAKIPYSEIYKKRRMAAVSQCSRFLWMFRCNKCNKSFNYRYLQKHKELFKNTLILIGKSSPLDLQPLKGTGMLEHPLTSFGGLIVPKELCPSGI